MFFRIPAWKVILSLLIFFPLALIPAMGQGALISSRASSGEVISDPSGLLTSSEGVALNDGQYILRIGGKESDNPLSTSDVAAIILTLLALGVVIGFVFQQQD